MALDSVVGQQRVAQLLRRVLHSGRVGHAYLFHGPVGLGKFLMAREFAKELLCQAVSSPRGAACESCPSCRQVDELAHPAMRLVLPSPKEPDPSAERAILDQLASDPYRVEQILIHPTISIERVRELRQFAAYAAAPGQRRVVIVPAADRMSVEAGNSFLKLLEEPPEDMVLILTSSDPNLLPDTIVSRCHLVRFSPVPEGVLAQTLVERFGVDEERARLVATLSGGSYAEALAWIQEDTAMLRSQAVELLRTALRALPEQVRFAQELAGRSDREARHRLLAFLHVLQLWLRDACLVAEFGEQALDLLANRDDLGVIQRFNQNLAFVDYDALFDALDEAAFQVRRNVALRLVLLTLIGRVRRSIRR